MKTIKMIIMDVDGTLTDGTINVSADGELFKAFDVKDGYAIVHLLPPEGIVPAIITGRESDIVTRRAEELKIHYLFQGVSDKAACLKRLSGIVSIPMEQIACIGDDLNDLPLAALCGVSGCPVDAVPQVRERCDYVCRAAGGHGAVREFIEWIIARNSRL